MEIYPQDLGEKRYQRLVPQEVTASYSHPATKWVLGCLLVAFVLLEIHTWPNIMFFAFWPLMYRRRWQKKRVHGLPQTPLSSAQVRTLLVSCKDPLERDYLNLTLAAVQMPQRPEQVAQTEIRDAIRALGAALDHVPTETKLPGASAHGLTLSAAELMVDADREADPVVAASLRRRAAARRQQAETVALLETQARRVSALRAELSDEISSLQTSLTVLSAQGVWSVEEMADVAAGISWIAMKAQGLAAAQAEMDEALHIHTLPAPLHDGPDGTRQRLSRHSMPGGEM